MVESKSDQTPDPTLGGIHDPHHSPAATLAMAGISALAIAAMLLLALLALDYGDYHDEHPRLVGLASVCIAVMCILFAVCILTVLGFYNKKLLRLWGTKRFFGRCGTIVVIVGVIGMGVLFALLPWIRSRGAQDVASTAWPCSMLVAAIPLPAFLVKLLRLACTKQLQTPEATAELLKSDEYATGTSAFLSIHTSMSLLLVAAYSLVSAVYGFGYHRAQGLVALFVAAIFILLAVGVKLGVRLHGRPKAERLSMTLAGLPAHYWKHTLATAALSFLCFGALCAIISYDRDWSVLEEKERYAEEVADGENCVRGAIQILRAGGPRRAREYLVGLADQYENIYFDGQTRMCQVLEKRMRGSSGSHLALTLIDTEPLRFERAGRRSDVFKGIFPFEYWDVPAVVRIEEVEFRDDTVGIRYRVSDGEPQHKVIKWAPGNKPPDGNFNREALDAQSPRNESN